MRKIFIVFEFFYMVFAKNAKIAKYSKIAKNTKIAKYSKKKRYDQLVRSLLGAAFIFLPNSFQYYFFENLRNSVNQLVNGCFRLGLQTVGTTHTPWGWSQSTKAMFFQIMTSDKNTQFNVLRALLFSFPYVGCEG